MPFSYIEVDDAIAADGLRMVVVSNVPSPWGEAAKGILHMKNIPWSAVRLAHDSPALKEWAGELTGPVAIYNNEKPRAGWAEILFLAERLAPQPTLIPEDAKTRAAMFGLCHELFGHDGLCDARRLHSVHGGLTGEGGFPEPIAKYLGHKYGYTPERGDAAGERVIALLNMLTQHLEARKAEGADYYFGNAPTAADVYSAASLALFAPLPEEQCDMNQRTRKTFNMMDDATRAALAPILLAHRDMMYEKHLELPLNL